MSNYSVTYYAWSQNYEERFINQPSEGVATIYFRTSPGSSGYKGGIVFDEGVTPTSTTIERYIEGSLSSTTTATTITTTAGGHTYTILTFSQSIFSSFVPGSVDIDAQNEVTNTAELNQLIYDYFNPVLVPYMDIDVYTQGQMITVIWSDIQNIPPGLYPASYQMVLDVRDENHDFPRYFLAVSPYTSGSYQFSFDEALNAMPPTVQQQVRADQAFDLYVDFGVTDPDAQGFPKVSVVNGCRFNINIMDGTITTEDSGDGNTPTPHSNTDPRTDDVYADDNSSFGTEAPGQALSVDNLVSKSYVITDGNLQTFATFLWNNDLQQTMYANQVSPMENILSLKRLPFAVGTTGSDVNIWLGNVQTNAQGKLVNDGHVQNIGSSVFQVFNDSYLDYDTNISIYLPYCGIFSIPTSVCYEQYKDLNGLPHIKGRKFKVNYYYDVIFGTCAAELVIVYEDDLGVEHDVTFAVYNGTCGIDIPVTQSNRASIENSMVKSGSNAAVGLLQSFVSGVASAVTGNGGGVLGAISNMVGTSLREQINQQTQERHYTTAGGFSSQVASFLSASVVVIYDHALYTEPGDYAHENGYPTNLGLNMSGLSGYTELDGSIEIEGISCLDEERALLKQALMDGFYL